ncbi:NMD protein affecting ribosome stability and mRNA decay [Sulfolobales archaeon HS-7]|nr:NMD protein affecting ribosome stability and mRNA decay [Sulfolobales archaeon HS-7]
MRKFCVLCGSEDEELIDSLCESCYISTKQLVKVEKEVSVKYCRSCGSIWVGGRWVQNSEEPLYYSIYLYVMKTTVLDEHVSEFKVNVDKIWKDLTGELHATISVSGKIRRESFTKTLDVQVEEDRSLCTRCLKSKGKDFEAVIQLRTSGKRLDNGVRQLFEETLLDQASQSIGDVKEAHNGFDYYLTDKSSARKTVSKFTKLINAKIIESYENERREDGKRKARLVISVRI